MGPIGKASREVAEAYEKKFGIPLVLDTEPAGFMSKKESEWLANEQERRANDVRAEVEAAALKIGIPSRDIIGKPTWVVRQEMGRIAESHRPEA